MSVLYTCGRMHKPNKSKDCSANAKAKKLAATVYKIMREELSESACERWCSRLDAELGRGTFESTGEATESTGRPVPQVWVPPKSKITLALLDEFERASKAIRSDDQRARLGSDTAISKLLARHVVEQLCRDKGSDWLRGTGELTSAQLDDPVKLSQALSRVAFDLLVYVHARASELKRNEETAAVLELHSADQTLVGRAMRGCGVVFCEAGREIFERSVASVREALSLSGVGSQL